MKKIGETGPEYDSQPDHGGMQHAVLPQFPIELTLLFLFHLPVISHEMFVFFRQDRLETDADHSVEQMKMYATEHMGTNEMADYGVQFGL